MFEKNCCMLQELIKLVDINKLIQYFSVTYFRKEGSLVVGNNSAYKCCMATLYYLYRCLCEQKDFVSVSMVCFDKDYIDDQGEQHYEVYLWDFDTDAAYELDDPRMLRYWIDMHEFNQENNYDIEKCMSAIIDKLISSFEDDVCIWSDIEGLSLMMLRILGHDDGYIKFCNKIAEFTLYGYDEDIFNEVYNKVML